MKRFRFSLRPVAILRAHHELRAREAFAAAVHAYVKAEQELTAVGARVRQFEVDLVAKRQGQYSPAEQANALADYSRECTAENEARQELVAAEHAMQERRLEYITAHRKLEVVRRLEEKARTAYRHETAREEQAEFDDYAGRRFARRSLKSA